MEPMTEYQHKVWTEADIMSLPDIGGKYELIEGEVLVTPASYPHEDLIANLISKLRPYVMKFRLGRIFPSDLGYWMKSGNLRMPDVSFVTREHLADMTREGEGFLHGAPDLAIEVLSPSNTIPAMKKKIAEYFENNCRLVWLVDSRNESVTVLRLDGSETTVTDTLTGEDVIPGFSLDVTELFEDWE